MELTPCVRLTLEAIAERGRAEAPDLMGALGLTRAQLDSRLSVLRRRGLLDTHYRECWAVYGLSSAGAELAEEEMRC